MVKEKPNSVRLYDEDGYRRRAACICVRSDAEAEVFYLFNKHSSRILINNLLGFACDLF